MRKIFVLMLVICSWGCQDDVFDRGATDCTPETGLNTHPDASLFETFLKTSSAAEYPGYQLAIITPKGYWSGAVGWADLDARVPMRTCHKTKLGSATKLVTAVETLRMVDAGLLALDDPISTYIDAGILGRVDNAKGVTVRHLLNHTSGIEEWLRFAMLPAFFDGAVHETKRYALTDPLRYIYDQPSSLKKGEFHYSNSNFLLLGLVIERVRGVSFADAMVRDFLRPLGLKSATFVSHSNTLEDGTAVGYEDLLDNGYAAEAWYLGGTLVLGPDSGLFMDVNDLARFYHALFMKRSILSPTSFEAMMDVTRFGETKDVVHVGYGLGLSQWDPKLFDTDAKLVGHAGSVAGYHANPVYAPDLDIIVIAKGSGSPTSTRFRELAFAFSKELGRLLF